MARSLGLGLVFIVPQENEGMTECEQDQSESTYILILKHQESRKLESLETNAGDDTTHESMETVLMGT